MGIAVGAHELHLHFVLLVAQHARRAVASGDDPQRRDQLRGAEAHGVSVTAAPLADERVRPGLGGREAAGEQQQRPQRRHLIFSTAAGRVAASCRRPQAPK